MMMEFNFVDGAHFANNSIKPVRITQFDENVFELFMVKGNFNHDLPSTMWLESFEEAVKTAEHMVGIKMEIGELLESA